ncbi:hypothetical protein FOMPIDRAFT_1130012 [Fomitopsis schrenkii]|uniref:ribonuclease H n=1 Tax=Fomitopsis schrenkii TaxID=2126942 RepID=S8F4U5_FOMSC|nr:hypothetical protein FOMPIDRAFT_1130012 [Fomitopsis schrenkii]
MDQSLDPHAGSQHVFNRKYELCDYLKQNFPTPDQLITSCRDCTTFLCVCCQHWNHERPLPCHNFRLIFTDGACLSNGTAAATSGAGIAMGQADRLQFSYPIDDSIDSTGKRTSQRAELLAAILGLGAAQSVEELADAHERLYNRHKAGEDAGLYSHWIITTDSKYLVDGMTDWLPNKWKRNGMRASDGRTPANLDLFLRLDEEITAIEQTHDIRIGFWHVAREFNTIADRLAKDAAKRTLPDPTV